MASLKVLQEQPTRLVLGKGGAGGIGSLIGIIIFGVVALVGLSALLEEGGAINPVMIVIMLLVGFFAVVSLWKSISSTRVILDADQKLAARTDSIFFIPTRQQTIAFNGIRDVSVTAPGMPDALSLDSAPIWQVALRGADGSNLVVNDHGLRSEMNALAEGVGILVGRPVKVGAQAAPQAPSDAVTYTAAGVWGSLVQNLAILTDSMGSSSTTTIAPTISAFPSNSPGPVQETAEQALQQDPFSQASARMTAQQVAAGAPVAATNAQLAAERESAFSSDVQVQAEMGTGQLAAGVPAVATNARMAANRATAFSSDVLVQSGMGMAQLAAGAPIVGTSAQFAMDSTAAFSSDVPVQAQLSAAQVAASSPFTQTSIRLAEQQTQAQAAMDFRMPLLSTMPQMPPMLSMGPPMDLPSFGSIGLGIETVALPVSAVVETRQVETQSREIDDDSAPLFGEAHKLLGARNYREAEKAYLRALSTNPADASAQNDLGVVYYAETKLHDAENAFRRAMALDLFNMQARYNLGLVLERQGKRSEAKEVFRVGAQTAGRGDSNQFQEAMRGVFHDPLSSSSASRSTQSGVMRR